MMKRHSNYLGWMAGLCIAWAALAGCDDEHAHDAHEGEVTIEEVAAEACAHFGAGPAATLTATEDAATAATAASYEHTRLDITLLAKPTGGFGGWVAVDLAEAGEVVLLSSDGATASVSADGGATTLAFETFGGPACNGAATQIFDGVVGRHVFELTADTANVSLVLEVADGEHAH